MYEKWPRVSLPRTRSLAAAWYCLVDMPPVSSCAERFLIADLVVKCYQSKVRGPCVTRKLVECIEARLVKWTLCRGADYIKVWQALETGLTSTM